MKGKTIRSAWNDLREHLGLVDDDRNVARTAFYCGAAWTAHRMQAEETRILGDALKHLGAEAMDATCYAAQDRPSDEDEPSLDALHAALSEVADLRAIKKRIDAHCATPKEKARYRTRKEGAWFDATEILAKVAGDK